MLRLRGGGGCIYIHLPDGRELTWQHESSMNVKSIKTHVCNEEEMEAHEFDLLYNDKVLPENITY